MQAEKKDCIQHSIGHGETAEHLDITQCARLGYEADVSLGLTTKDETPKTANLEVGAYTVFVSLSRAKNALWTRELLVMLTAPTPPHSESSSEVHTAPHPPTLQPHPPTLPSG